MLAGRPLDPVWRAEVEKVSHRHYSTGFFYGQPGQFTQDARYIRDWQVVAEVVSCDQRGLATASLRNKFAQGDAIELVGPDVRPVAFTAPMMADETGAPLESPASADEISFSCPVTPAPLVPAGLPGELVIGPNRHKTHPWPGAARPAGGGFFQREKKGAGNEAVSVQVYPAVPLRFGGRRVVHRNVSEDRTAKSPTALYGILAKCDAPNLRILCKWYSKNIALVISES